MTHGFDEFVQHSLRTSMFFPSSRLMVAGNPKAAGTSLRWWLLPLHGVDVTERTAHSLWGESAPYQTVWDGRIDLTFTWNNLTDEVRQDALTATDVLTVHPVRHPVTRCFSAWSGKYLNHEPYYNDRLPESFSRLPQTIESPEQVTALFEDFVRALRAHVDDHGWETLDVHFWPQHRLLGRVPNGDLLVLRQEWMAEGLATISDHLARHGLDAGSAPRINENIVPYQQEYISQNALGVLTDVYGEDFTTWSYLPEAPAAKPRDTDFTWLNDVRGRNSRYQVIHEAALTGRRQLRDSREQLAQSHDELRRAKDREHELLSSTSWRLTRPVRWLADQLRRLRRWRNGTA